MPARREVVESVRAGAGVMEAIAAQKFLPEGTAAFKVSRSNFSGPHPGPPTCFPERRPGRI